MLSNTPEEVPNSETEVRSIGSSELSVPDATHDTDDTPLAPKDSKTIQIVPEGSANASNVVENDDSVKANDIPGTTDLSKRIGRPCSDLGRTTLDRSHPMELHGTKAKGTDAAHTVGIAVALACIRCLSFWVTNKQIEELAIILNSKTNLKEIPMRQNRSCDKGADRYFEREIKAAIIGEGGACIHHSDTLDRVTECIRIVDAGLAMGCYPDNPALKAIKSDLKRIKLGFNPNWAPPPSASKGPSIMANSPVDGRCSLCVLLLLTFLPGGKVDPACEAVIRGLVIVGSDGHPDPASPAYKTLDLYDKNRPANTTPVAGPVTDTLVGHVSGGRCKGRNVYQGPHVVYMITPGGRRDTRVPSWTPNPQA